MDTYVEDRSLEEYCGQDGAVGPIEDKGDVRLEIFFFCLGMRGERCARILLVVGPVS